MPSPLQKDLIDRWGDGGMKMHNNVGADQCVCPDKKENGNEYTDNRANTQVRPYKDNLPDELDSVLAA